MSKEISKKADWYVEMISECKAIVTESIFNSKFSLIEGYFSLGQRLRDEGEKAPISELVRLAARDLEMTERNIWFAIQAVDKFGTPEKLPEGKNISWNKVKILLQAPKDAKVCEHEEFIMIKICTKCNKKL